MEAIRFVFWEAVKILALAFLGLVASKAVAGLSLRRAWIKPALYALILGFAASGAWYAGTDVAAEVYLWSCSSNLDRGELVKAYSNALRAVAVRPGDLHYWRALVESKIRLHQFESALDDEATLRALGGGNLDEVDEYQFTLCSYFLSQNNQVIATTLRLIRQNPSYAAPYVLQGLAYIAEKKYPEAEQSFLAILQIFPSHQSAVEGLARAYFLAGDRQRALAVLDETVKYPFPPVIRQRFQALKELYAQ